MMAKIFYYGIVFSICILSIDCSYTKAKCIGETSCLCRISDYETIDISKLFDEKDHNKQFLEDSTRTNLSYFFSGCKDIKIDNTIIPGFNNSGTKTGSLIVYNITSGNLTLIGNAKQITFDQDEQKEYEIVYRQGENIATVRLLCDNFQESFFKVISNNTFVLSSPKVCVHKEPQGHGFGSVFVTIFAISSLIYFIGGALFLYFFKGARGIELIPNIDFWRALPGLIRDGTIFIFSGCRTTHVSTAESYDRI